MKTKTIRIIFDIYKASYIFSIFFCLFFLACISIASMDHYVMANIINLIDVDLLKGLRGGDFIDPIDYANFFIK